MGTQGKITFEEYRRSDIRTTALKRNRHNILLSVWFLAILGLGLLMRFVYGSDPSLAGKANFMGTLVCLFTVSGLGLVGMCFWNFLLRSSKFDGNHHSTVANAKTGVPAEPRKKGKRNQAFMNIVTPNFPEDEGPDRLTIPAPLKPKPVAQDNVEVI